MDLKNTSAVLLAQMIRNREVSVLDVTKEALNIIKEKEKSINGFITVDEEYALKRARILQEQLDNGVELGPLAGVPIAIKDNICTKGIRTTCGSKMLENFVPTYSASVVERLEDAGCIILGKTNMDEFAMGSTTETSYYGVTRNPYNENCVPGGSSGGACAAVASDECLFALGSDTGGSIRQPSAYCNVVGLKPTYGTVSRYGLVAFASSLDQIGPIGKSVSDVASIMEVIAFYDKKDSTSVNRLDFNATYKFTEALKDDVKGMKVAIPVNYLNDGLNEDIITAIYRAADILTEKGAIVEKIEIKLSEYALPAYYTISSAEASSNLARFDGVKYGYRSDVCNKNNEKLANELEDRDCKIKEEQEYGIHEMYKKTRSEGFGKEVKRRIMLGTYVLSSGYYDEYYMKAMKVKTLIKKEFDEIFGKYDIVLGPVTKDTAPKIGTSLEEPLKMYSGDVYTVAANLAGIPAMSLPMGLDKKGMPIAIQISANSFEENKIIRTAFAIEKTKGCI